MTSLTPAETPRGQAIDAAIEDLLRAIDADDDGFWDEIDTPRPSRAAPVAVAPRPTPVLYAPPGYRRDAVGRWRYERTGGYVPAARDIRVADVLPNVATADAHLVHASAVRLYRPLEFLCEYPITVHGATPMLRVPLDAWAEAAPMILGLTAPELAPSQLLDTAAVAAVCRVSQRTVSAYLARGRFVEPVARIGSNPVWSLPVVLQWLARRR